MIYTQEQANDFINDMAHFDMSLSDFTNGFRNKFYPDCDIQFMNQYLDWHHDYDEFIVSQEVLYRYGIASENKISTIKDRIKVLDLKESIDFTLTKFRVARDKRGSVEKHHYAFTPKSFKLLLLSATKQKKQNIDVSTYSKYYLFLEEAVMYYHLYQLEITKRKLTFSDQKFRFANAQLNLIASKQTHQSSGTTKNETSYKQPRSETSNEMIYMIEPKIGDCIKVLIDNHDIDLRVDAYKLFIQKRKCIIDLLNKKNELLDKEFNNQLKKEIKIHNSTHSFKRKYPDEMRITPKIRTRDISVSFNKQSFSYQENPYMSINDVIQIVKDIYTN